MKSVYICFSTLIAAAAIFAAPASANTVTIYNDASVGRVTLTDSDKAILAENGTVAFLNAYASSQVEVQNGGNISHLTAHESSSVTLLPGSDLSHSTALDSSHYEITGGTVSFLNFYDNSSANIYGMQSLSYLQLGSTSNVSLFGHDFAFDPLTSSLNGTWMDGTIFNIGLRTTETPDVGITVSSLPTNLNLVTVPLPGCIVLFLSGLIPLFRVRKRI